MEKTFINYFPVEEGKSGIKIKPENKGKFNATKKRTGKTTEELTHSKNPLTRKRAIFAQNAKKWHHKEGGLIEYFQEDDAFKENNYLYLIPKAQQGYKVQRGDTFGGIAQKYGMNVQQLQQLNPNITNPDKIQEGITLNISQPIKQVKTIDGIKIPNNINNVDLTPVNLSKFNAIVNQDGTLLKVDNQLLSDLDNYLIQKNIGLPQRQAILYNVVQEGSTTGSHDNGAYGYLGWRGDRIPGRGINQMQYLYDTIFGDFNANHWNHGGTGSGYKTGKEAQQVFINATDLSSALRALTYGYVRPDASTRKFRSTNGAKYFQTGGVLKLISK